MSISSFAAALDSKDNDVGKEQIANFDQSQETIKSIDLTNSDELVSFMILNNSCGNNKEFITKSFNNNFANNIYIEKLKVGNKYCYKIERYYCKISY